MRGIDVKAVTAGDQEVPNLLAWLAPGDLEDRIDEIEDEGTPDDDMDRNEQPHIVFSDRHKNTKVLKEDGKLDQEYDNAVNNGPNIDPLD